MDHIKPDPGAIYVDHIDLMVDEFTRIAALVPSGTEIAGLCQRALATTRQRVPVITQRDVAEQALRSYGALLHGELFHIARHTDEESPAVTHIQAAGRLADAMLANHAPQVSATQEPRK